MGEARSCSCPCECNNKFEIEERDYPISLSLADVDNINFDKLKSNLTIYSQCENGFHVTRIKIEDDDL